MADMEYDQIEMEEMGMKVILQFPQKAEQEEFIRQEVKSILSQALQEVCVTWKE